MRTIATILLWLAACVFCFGQTSVITGTVKSPNGQPYQTQVSFLSKSTPVGISGNLVPTKVTATTATNGTFSQALFAGNYQVTIKGAPGANGWSDSVFTIGVPTNASTYDITELMTNVIGAIVYTSTNQFYNFYASNNISMVTNGSNVFISSTGGLSTNAYSLSLTGTAFGPLTVGTNWLVVTNGRVGIGTNTPSTALEVSGTVKATVFVGDGSGLTGITGGSGATLNGTNQWSGTNTFLVTPRIYTATNDIFLDIVGNWYNSSGIRFYAWDEFESSPTLFNSILTDTNGYLRIVENSTGNYYCFSSGKLGVNTFQPTYSLDAPSGTLRVGPLTLINGSITLNGTTNLWDWSTIQTNVLGTFVKTNSGSAWNLTLYNSTIANGHIYPGGSTPFSQYDIGQVNNFWRLGYISNLYSVNINATTNTAEYFVGDGSLLTGVLTTNDIYDITNGPNVSIGTNVNSVYPYIPSGARMTNVYLDGVTTISLTPTEPGADDKLMFHSNPDSNPLASTITYSNTPTREWVNTNYVSQTGLASSNYAAIGSANKFTATNSMPELQANKIIVTNGITWSNNLVRAVLPGSNITGTTNSDGSLTLAASASGSSFSTNMTTHEKVSLAVIEAEFGSAGSQDADFNIGAAGSGSATAGTSETNHPGVVSLSTATSATGAGFINSGGNSSITFGGGELGMEWIIKTPSALADGSETYALYVGISDSVAGDATDGVYFRYSTASANWIAVSRGGSAESTADTGLPAAASTWYRLGVHVNSDASTVTYYTNGVAACTITGSNVPTTSEQSRYCALILKSNGTTARAMLVDYARFWKVISR